jgi:hypothetical protein
MALWGNSDNVTSVGVVTCNYVTTDSNGNVIVNGWNTQFGVSGSGQVGDVIRFGTRNTADPSNSTYVGDAVIASVASATQISIASTSGLSGAPIQGLDFTVSELPLYTVGDVKYSDSSSGTRDSFVYGVAANGVASANKTKYEVAHAGWVGVTTYMDNHGNLRVKSEVLVAASGITTGNVPAYPPKA